MGMNKPDNQEKWSRPEIKTVTMKLYKAYAARHRLSVWQVYALAISQLMKSERKETTKED